MQCLSSRINTLWHAGSRHLKQDTLLETMHVYKASKGAVDAPCVECAGKMMQQALRDHRQATTLQVISGSIHRTMT